MGIPWSHEERMIALQMCAQGEPAWKIGIRIGRTTKAVKAFLGHPERVSRPVRNDALHEPIGRTKDDDRFEHNAARGSRKLLEAIVRVHG